MSRYDDALAENPSLLDDLSAAESGVSVAARPPAAPVIASRSRSPDEHAKLLDLAKETQTPPRLAEAAPEAVRQKADLNRYDQLIDSNPGLVDWLQDYDNAVVSQDDHGPLAKIENAFRDMREGLSIGWEQGSLQDPDHPGMQAAYQRLTGEQTPESELRRQEWKRQMQASRAKPGFASNAGRIPAYGVRQAETYLREFAQGAAPAAGAGIIAGAVAPLAIPATAPAAVTSGIALGKANTYLLSYKQNATLAFDEFMDLRDEAGQPMPENVARVAAMTVGAVNASLDMIGLKAVTGALPAPKLTPEAIKEAMRRALSRPTFRKALLAAGQRAGRAVAVEGATEGLQEAFQVFMGELAKGQSGQVFKDADAGDVVKRVMQASLEGGLIAGSLAVPGQGVQVAIDVVDVRRSKSRYEAMKKIAEAKTESKTAGRAPDRVAAFVQQVAAGQAKVETVEIPAQKFTEYFQSVGADPEEAAGEMGVMAEAFRKARDQGGDITVPIADYVRAVSGTPADEALLPHARIGDAPSYAEIQAERERVMAILAEGKDSAFGEGKAADPADVAYQAIYGQVLSAGISERTADVIATLWQERLRARAERLGVDPSELWAAADVSIKKPLPDVLTTRGDTVVAELDADLDRLRRGDIPSQTEVFGKSLAEFLMERGGLRDEGGELAAIDAKKAFASMRGFRGLVNQSTGMTMASAAELAAQAGYIDVDEHGKFSDHDIVEALADEAAGNPRRRRDAGIDEAKAGKRAELLNLDQYLSEQGIDLNALTNEQVRAKLAEASAATSNAGTGAEFYQGYRPYQNAPDSLMGFSRHGPQKGPGEQKYKTFVPVKISWPDGMTHIDGMYGLNKPHALERARRNWPDATVEETTQEEFESSESLYQADANEKRGRIAFGTDEKGRPQIRITILKKANFSTFVHETGHAFLEEMRRDVEMLRAKESAPVSGTVRERLHAVAANLGIKVSETTIRFKSGGGAIEIPPIDHQTEGAETADHVFAHELGHAILQKRGVAFHGMPIAQVAEIIPNWKDIRAAASRYAPKKWQHENKKIRDHARKNEEILADAIGSVLLGDNPISLLEPMMSGIGMTLADFGMPSPSVAPSDAASLTPLQRGVIADFDALMKYLGVAPGEDITRDAHEKFARSFEAYAREGKAPSHALREAFQRFRQFLVRIYQTLKGLDVELTDEVRGIMDRMLATDEAISFAENRLASSPISPEVAKQLGMTNEQYATYVARRFAARDAAAEALSQDAIREHFKRQSAEYRDLRKATEDEVRAETEALPVYRAMLMFTRGRAPGEGVKPFKLTKVDVEGRYGAAGWVTDGKTKRPNIPMRLRQLKAIGGAADTVYSMRTAADVLGFKSADDMVSALIEAKPFEEYVRAETDRVLSERMDDPTRDARIIEAAIQEVLSDKRQALLFEELRILQSGSRRSDSLLATVRASAKQAIGETVVSRLDPQSYLRKSERAAADFNKAMRDGDVELATAAKYRQIVMHELYKEAVRARDEAKIATGILRDAARKKAFERLAKAGVQYVEAMKALLSSVRLVTLTQKELAIRAQVRDFATALAESGEAVTMSEATLAAVESAKERALNELTVAELRLLRDDVKNLAHIAGRQASIIRQGEAVAREEAITAMVDRARSSSKGGKGAPIAESFMSGGEHALQTLSQMGMAIKGAETLIEWLDGGSSGPWHSYFYDLANKGEYDREILRERFLRPLVEFTAGMNRARRNELTEMVKLDTLGIELPRAVLISMALNFGTQSNLDRVIAGGFVDPSARNTVISLNMDTVDEIVSKLSEADWTQIKTFWSTLEGMWPEIQAFQERMGGLVPPKIEGRTITTPFGDVQGSYWPIVYNPRGSMAGAKQEVESSTAVGALMGNHSRATTGHSFLFERTVSAGPLLFDYSAVLSRHIDEVLTDLTHREFVIQATKILADPRVKLAMDDSISVAGSKSLEGMVARTIREDRAIGEAANKGWNTVIETLRRNTVLAAMGFKIGIVAGNVALAHFQAYARIVGQPAKAAYAAGLAQFYRHPVDSMKFVRDSSAMMRHRVQNLEHSYTTIMQEIAGRHDVIAGIARVAMSVHLGGDMIVTPAIWLGEYRRVLESGEADGHDAAVLAADKIIRQTQTAGAPKDLSAFEGQAWARRWGVTMFYGPMRIMGNRMTDAAGRRGVVKTWPEALGVMLFAWILPAIMWDIVTGKEIDDEDEDGRIVDDIAFRWAVVTGAYPGLTIPIFRDVTNYVQRDVLGEFTQPRMNPLADGVLMAYRAGKTLKNETVAWIDGEDVDWRQVFSSILRGVGPATGLPTGQLETSGKFVYDVASGEFEPEDATDLKYLFKRRPEE